MDVARKKDLTTHYDEVQEGLPLVVGQGRLRSLLKALEDARTDLPGVL